MQQIKTNVFLQDRLPQSDPKRKSWQCLTLIFTIMTNCAQCQSCWIRNVALGSACIQHQSRASCSEAVTQAQNENAKHAVETENSPLLLLTSVAWSPNFHEDVSEPRLSFLRRQNEPRFPGTELSKCTTTLTSS